MLRSSIFLLIAFSLSPAAAIAQAPATPGAATSDLSSYSTADSLWLHIQELKKSPQTRPTSEAEFRAFMQNGMTKISAAVATFLSKYPNDPRKWDARLLQIETNEVLGEISGQPDTTAAREGLSLLANEKDAPPQVRGEARYQLFGTMMQDYLRGTVSSDTVIDQLNQFIADFPTYPNLDVIKWKVAQALKKNDPNASDKLLSQLATSGQGQIADLARGQLALKEKLKAPLDLHFTAVDGKPVDISQLRGKVVLIDFWATWCGPCKAEMPEVISVYNELHSKGFEIIGISLDQDRDKLTSFIAQQGMPWPQYFDGKGWQNAISSSFFIDSIPAMWLVNKHGYVVTTDGRQGLEDQIKRLLADDSQ